MRLAAVVFTVLLRFVLMPVYLQAYLNLAYHRIEDQKKEAGRITNVDLQKKITSIFYYLCVVTLQYVAPILMCLYFALMYKTLGEYTWTGFLKEAIPLDECSADLETQLAMEAAARATTAENNIAATMGDASVMSTAQTIQNSLHSLKGILTKDVYRGILGFATWWCCFIWFAATSLGMVYQSYFSKT